MRYTIAVMIALALGANAQANGDSPGVREVTITNPARSNAVRALVWYPTTSTAQPTRIGASAVFVGSEARPDAEVATGKHPLILISHGGFRSAANSANWLASAMAEQEYIAAVVSPPTIGSGSPSGEVLNELYLRPQDLSETISALAANEALRGSVDFDRIAVVGFFLGGYSALALAGIQLDAMALANSCSGTVRSIDCEWLKSGSVDLRTLDTEAITRPVQDNRIRAVVAIDPEWIRNASPSSLEKPSASIHLVNVGPWSLPESALNVSELATEIPRATYTIVHEAGPFSVFGECTAKGPAVLKEEGESVLLCQDGGARKSRTEIHRELVRIVSTLLSKTLGKH